MCSNLLKFGLLVFFKAAWDDSSDQSLTTSRGKNHDKNFGNQI